MIRLNWRLFLDRKRRWKEKRARLLFDQIAALWRERESLDFVSREGLTRKLATAWKDDFDKVESDLIGAVQAFSISGYDFPKYLKAHECALFHPETYFRYTVHRYGEMGYATKQSLSKDEWGLIYWMYEGTRHYQATGSFPSDHANGYSTENSVRVSPDGKIHRLTGHYPGK